MRANKWCSNVAWILLIRDIFNVLFQFSAQNTIQNYLTKPHWFSSVSEIGRKSTTEWMAGGQGQPAAKGVAESKLRAPSLKLPSQLPCPVHGTSEERRGPEKWCLILRATAGDSPDMENSMRMVSGTRFFKAAPCIAAFMPALLFWVSPSSTTELPPFAAPQGCSSPFQPTQLSDSP